MTNNELERLDDDRLRLEAKNRGIIVGKTLSRQQLLSLLSPIDGDDEEELHCERRVPPFSTLSMAEVYMAQGLHDEALQICRTLLTQPAQDSRTLWGFLEKHGLRDELMAWKRSLRRWLPQSYGGSWIQALAGNPTSLFVFWEIDESSANASRTIIGEEEPRRVLRLFSVWTGPDGSSSRDIIIEGWSGEAFLRGVRPRAAHRVAIGWKSGELFLPLCHTERVARTAAAGPSDHLRASWAAMDSSSRARRAPMRARRLLESYSRDESPPWQKERAAFAQLDLRSAVFSESPQSSSRPTSSWSVVNRRWTFP